jgi:hypothetical protein
VSDETSWLKEQLRAGGSYTILSAVWLGRLSPKKPNAKPSADTMHTAWI